MALAASVALAAAMSADASKPVSSRTFEFKYTVRSKELPKDARRLRIWIPVPASDAQQGISDLALKSPAPYEMHEETGEGWGRGDAIYACNVKKGNCTDFHALFIGMARAAGIPARFEIGFPLPRDRKSGEIAGYHCWARFWVDGLGWVPVDASEGWKDPARRDYFFGAHDANRVLFTRGRDIRLDPAQQGDALNYFVYPYAELDGRPWTGVQSSTSFSDLEPGGASAAAR